MRKFIVSVIASALLISPTLVFAKHGHHAHVPIYKHGHLHRTHNGAWVFVPALILGGLAGAAMAKENQQQPVVIQSNPNTVYVECSEWKEIQTPDGKIYRERTCVQKQ